MIYCVVLNQNLVGWTKVFKEGLHKRGSQGLLLRKFDHKSTSAAERYILKSHEQHPVQIHAGLASHTSHSHTGSLLMTACISVSRCLIISRSDLPRMAAKLFLQKGKQTKALPPGFVFKIYHRGGQCSAASKASSIQEQIMF